MQRRHERPLRRVYPGGRVVWVARFTGKDGKRASAGTFDLKRVAQGAIDAAYDADLDAVTERTTIGGYFDVWLDQHARAERTERSYRGRIRSVLDVKVDGRPLRAWYFDELARGHAYMLVDHMLRKQGRAATGAKGVIVVLSAMAEDAITDGFCRSNPFKGVKVRASDRRVQKPPRKIRTWTWEQMHDFARAATLPVDPMILQGGQPVRTVNDLRAAYAEAMLRVLSDCGLRLGELLALERRHWHGDVLEVRQTAHRRRVADGTKTDHGVAESGREVPVAPDLQRLLEQIPPRLDSRFLFPAEDGGVWEERGWYRRFWEPARERTGIHPKPHEFRHSWISLLAAAGVDPADLAEMAGHSVQTMTGHYRHALKRSMGAARAAVGA